MTTLPSDRRAQRYRPHWKTVCLALGAVVACTQADADDFAFTPVFGTAGFVWQVGIDGTAAGENPTLTLIRGRSYTFAVTGLAGFHTFYINTANATGAGHAYAGGGLSDNGIASDTPSNAPITFDVPQDAPDLLFYNCGIHASMAGRIDIAIYRDGFD
ncbi:MAG: hypothetical protein WBV39_03560 [Rudaea sp.]